jgi:hypothetical protein
MIQVVGGKPGAGIDVGGPQQRNRAASRLGWRGIFESDPAGLEAVDVIAAVLMVGVKGAERMPPDARMCGRFVVSLRAALADFRHLDQPIFRRGNIAPTQPIPVVMIENGVRHFRLMRWGPAAGLGQGSPQVYPADQRALRNGAGKAGLQERHQAAALPDPGRRLL